MEDIIKIIDFLKIFADKCHHAKEEEILFPKLNKFGLSYEYGPLSVMLYEHNLSRSLIKNMQIALDAIQNDSS